jgi:hypothetical protein
VRETVAQFGRVRSDSIGPIYRPAKIKPGQFTSQSAVLRLHHVNCCAIQSDLRHPARAESEKEGDATTVVTGGAGRRRVGDLPAAAVPASADTLLLLLPVLYE